MSDKGAGVEDLLPLPAATFHILLALAEDDRHGYGIIQDVAARTDGALRLSSGDPLPLDPAHARAGVDRRGAGAPGARAGRRAPALLPDHALRNRGGSRGGGSTH